MGNTKLFFRVEDYQQQGPYGFTTPECLRRMQDEHNRDGWSLGGHPSVRIDLPDDFVSGHHVCGFSSVNRMLSWFKGFGPDLDRADFRINVYRVPSDELICGRKQDIVSVYALEEAERVESFSPKGL